MNFSLNEHRKLSVAPMLDYTDRHDRYFLRLLTKHTLLYTEMIAANALVHTDPEPFLKHDISDNPVAIQLGGGDPEILAKAAQVVALAGYDEINLNCGCPSDRVQSGAFGACLMKDKERVADCVRALREVARVPVTVKCRIGVDQLDSEDFFFDFIQTVAAAGCDTFIVHARKAWLKGLSPKENREVPPLNYERVFKLKELFPHLNITLNGGVKTLAAAQEILKKLDGVMIGREAYENPWMLREADALIYGDSHAVFNTRKELMQAYLPYLKREQAAGCPLTILTRHLLNVFNGEPGARTFRRTLSEGAPRAQDGAELVLNALQFVK